MIVAYAKLWLRLEIAIYRANMERLRAREKQVTYLIQMINNKGGVQDEFDKLALIEMGLIVGGDVTPTTCTPKEDDL